MRLLVLGGTWFVGREVTEQAVGRGWEVTIFHRGRSGTAPAGVSTVRGDRERADDLSRLAAAGPWDHVLDVAGAIPTVVRDSARALAPVAKRYNFISTVSAYARWPHEPVDEQSQLHPGDPDWDPGFRHWDAVAYGPLKAGCEVAIHREYPPDRVLIVRPGVVLGPNEYVGRMRWWLNRCRRGGQLLAPGRPDRFIQPVDVRDLASFVLDLVAAGASGALNAAAPRNRDTYGDLIQACIDVTASSAEPVWVDEQWLARHGVQQWTELPLWRIPRGTWAMDDSRARAAGLRCRPIQETVKDTWRWLVDDGHPVEHERDAEHGIDARKERELIHSALAEHAVVQVGPARSAGA